MRSEWPKVRLEEVTTVLGDGLHGTPEYDDQGDYYFINGNNLSDGQIVFNEKTRRVGEAEYQRHRKNLNDRTILVSINGTLGNIALYRGEKIVLGKSACYFNVRPGVDKHFVRYVVASPDFQEYLNTLATGSTIKNASLRLMRDFVFQLPSLKQQEIISATLSALDDRIDLLRQNSTTLESIVQALFKSWFIDFDPVRAKQAGREPEGMDAATAALFPAEFEESALGLIPKGWHVVPLNQEGLVQIGGVWGEESRTDKCSEPVSCLRGIDAVDIGLGNVPAPPTRWVSAKQIGSRRLLEGDILIEGSGSFCGRSLYWAGHYEQLLPLSATYSNFVKRVSSPRGPHVSRWVQRHLDSIYQSGEVKNYRTGSAFPNLDLTGMLSVERILPPEGLLERFHELMQAIETAKSCRIRQVDTLLTLRATLLPRLISGKLRLPEAQEQLEDVLA